MATKYSRPKAMGGKARPILIFLLIAGIAAGGVYLLLPKAARPDGGEEIIVAPGGTGEVEIIVPDGSTAGSGGTAEVEIVVDPAVGGAGGTGDAVVDPQVGEAEKKAEPEAPAADDSEPVKGVPHPSDPPHDEPAVPVNTASEVEVEAALAAIDAELAAANYAAARDAAGSLAAKLTPRSEPWRQAARRLSRANLTLYFTAPPELYTVKSGDTMYRIAYEYRTTIEAIMRQNQLKTDSNLIRVGQKFKLYKGDWRLVVSKSGHLLSVYDGDRLFCVYDVGIGRQGKTPAGQFVIGDKQVNPAYYAPDGRIIPYGEAGNVMGSRWFKLVPTDRKSDPPRGYGIHGTSDESSVTQSLSNGCIRMRNAEVEELFVIVPTQTPVTIEE